MLDPSKKKERVFSKSVFKGTERSLSDSEDSNEKNLYNKSQVGIQDALSMIEPNENLNFDTKNHISKITHATHLNIA